MDRRQIGYMNGVVILLAWVSVTLAGTVSEETQRYMAQGVAAVEMAKSPADYEDVISKFEKAKSLSPDWPDVYYNLGLIQEKAGKYRDAVTTLKQYLRLAPNAEDAATVKSLIAKLEYKAEQEITDEDVLDIFASLMDSNLWQMKGITNANLFDPNKWIKSIQKIGQRLWILAPGGTCSAPAQYTGMVGVSEYYAIPSGKALEFKTRYCLCDKSDRSCENQGAEYFRYYLEVVSRRKITMTMRKWYTKEMGGGTKDASFEFVRR